MYECILYVYVCVCVCVCVCMCMGVHASMFMCVHTPYLCTCFYVCMCAHQKFLPKQKDGFMHDRSVPFTKATRLQTLNHTVHPPVQLYISIYVLYKKKEIAK